ncbi:hypothetical protein AV530_016905 [Patagioenas fasciata monilis]|uniref:Uncharacterized protein n=1 Tax=Patagioenas fasciata monilis TaxID=372326 RepID=A0A1V4J405_PATFA|nr:hypothetical protein AV530_016905 [Patagioenas fasciata monilis]
MLIGIGSIDSSRTVRQDRIGGKVRLEVQTTEQVYCEKADMRFIQEVYPQKGIIKEQTAKIERQKSRKTKEGSWGGDWSEEDTQVN